MYVYSCNVNMTTATKNWSDKKMIRAFTSFTTDLKSRVINPGLNFMDNKLSTAPKTSMDTMDINYQLPPPSNHTVKNE